MYFLYIKREREEVQAIWSDWKIWNTTPYSTYCVAAKSKTPK